MTAIEIKTELHRVVDHIPESALEQALELLKELTESANKKSERRAHLNLILKEDKELLLKLAQ